MLVHFVDWFLRTVQKKMAVMKQKLVNLIRVNKSEGNKNSLLAAYFSFCNCAKMYMRLTNEQNVMCVVETFMFTHFFFLVPLCVSLSFLFRKSSCSWPTFPSSQKLLGTKNCICVPLLICKKTGEIPLTGAETTTGGEHQRDSKMFNMTVLLK